MTSGTFQLLKPTNRVILTMKGTAEADIFIKKTGVAALYPSNAGDTLPETDLGGL
jgi:hypothetical protein